MFLYLHVLTDKLIMYCFVLCAQLGGYSLVFICWVISRKGIMIVVIEIITCLGILHLKKKQDRIKSDN